MKLRLTSGGLQSIANVASRPRASFGSTRQRAWLAFQYKREIVARHGCWAQGRREVSGIVGRAELIEAGISFPARDVVNGAGCCVPTRGEPNLRNNHGIATERRNQAGWIARKRRRIASHHHRFQIDIVDRYDPNFRGRRREWIGGLEGRRQIAQRIAHWPVDEGLPVLRVSIEILARKLPHAYGDTIVQPSLLDPPRIEASRVRTHQAAGPGQEPQIQSEIASSLRECGRVEVQSVLPGELAKIDVDRCAEAVPRRKLRRLLTPEAPQGVADILKSNFTPRCSRRVRSPHRSPNK
jgi:hypothetical protein